MAEQRYDVIVIGGGPGGYTAALYCARSGLSVAVLEQLSAGGQMATTGEVENYPGFEEGVDGFELGEKMQKGAERFGVKTIYARAESVDLNASPKRIGTSEGPFEARAVVISTGAYPRELGLPKERELRGRGVAYCAACDGMAYRGKTVVVSGGGNSAVADALLLVKLCKKVYLVHRRDSLRASAVYLKALTQSGVEFLWNTQITGLVHDKRLAAVTLSDLKTGEERTLPCDGLFVAVGRVPDTALFVGQVALDESGYLIADETTRTSVPGVFAVGDVRTKPMRQIVTATADGAVASQFIEEFLLEQ